MCAVCVENLERDIALIRKKRNRDVVRKGSDISPITRIPLDSPGLMRITSGGIPLGRITRLWGGKSSAKSLLGWSIIKGAQEILHPKYPEGLTTCYYDVEKIYEPTFTKSLGVDIVKLHIVETDIIEDIAEEMQLLLGSRHVHLIDSCSEAKPQDRLNKPAGDWDVGLKIRVWEKAFEYIMNAMDKTENAIITIDHASKDFMTKSEKPLGGKEREHQSSLSLHMKATKWLYYDDEGMLQTEDKLKEKGILGIAGQREADGQEIVVKASKSRVCRPLRVANMRLDLHTFKFDYTFELMQGAEYFDKMGGVAHRSGQPAIAQAAVKGPKNPGGWVILPDGEKIQGERKLRQRIEQDIDLQRLIRRAMLSGN
jgi:RecA/RadA recombinase